MFEFKKESTVYTYYKEKGKLIIMRIYINGLAEGKFYRDFGHNNGYYISHYKNGLLNGSYTIRTYGGEILLEREYDNGRIVNIRGNPSISGGFYRHKETLKEYLGDMSPSIKRGCVSSVIFNENKKMVFNGKITPEIMEYIISNL